ncbi:hypothetical protein [Nostoc sp.]|uniref:hypothetical protein n=1 Tax=Nostoc sp. TaxID=1180 RepID=UPI002FFA02B0
MRNFQHSLFSLVLLPLVVASGGISGSIAFFWERKPRRRLVSRSSVCPISPGLIDTYIVWSDRLLFLWYTRDHIATDSFIYKLIKADLQEESQLLETEKVQRELARFVQNKWKEIAVAKTLTFEQSVV